MTEDGEGQMSGKHKDVLEDLFAALEKNPASRWAFGEKIRIGEREIVPVSEVRAEVEIPLSTGDDDAPRSASARVEGRPIGYLSEVESQVVFVPIQVSPSDAAPPGWIDDLLDRATERLERDGRGDRGEAACCCEEHDERRDRGPARPRREDEGHHGRRGRSRGRDRDPRS
jgi:hypothetical protein